MKKRILAVILALVMCLALLPTAAFAAEDDLPDWYLLFAIFKNVDADFIDADGKTIHTKYSMTPEEVDLAKQDAEEYEKFMNQVGVIRAHVDVVEIDSVVKELEGSEEQEGYLASKYAATLLEGKVDLDEYDHVTCGLYLDVPTTYWGLTSLEYENGTGHSSINLKYCTGKSDANPTPETVYVHEFLHFMEVMDQKWGYGFNLHDVRLKYYEPKEEEENCYTDIMLNRAKGDAGTGVPAMVWQYSPRVLRSTTELTIPSGVTGIGNQAFYGRTNLTSVTIPSGVTSIGNHAFYGCTGLTSVTIPDGVTSIGDVTFYGCTGLTSVSIPSSVTSIGNHVFNGCTSLTSVTIPSGVTSIGEAAFYGCRSMTSLSIPSSVTTIGNHAFHDCTGLTSVTIPSGVTSIGASAFDDCTKLTSVTLPDSVTNIEYGAFSGCFDLGNVVIPTGVTSIEGAVFYDCGKMTSISIPSGVTSIGEHAFRNCKGLKQVYIPASVTEIGETAFYNSGVEDVYYGGSEEQWNKIEISDYNDALTSATIHYNSTGLSAQPEQPSNPDTSADPTNDKLTMDGKDYVPAAYKINGMNYFKLRDVAMMMNGTEGQFSVEYDGDAKAIRIVTGEPYTPVGGELGAAPTQSVEAVSSNDTVYINGEKVELAAYKIGGGVNFYGIRELARRLGFNVGWTAERGMYIESDKPYTDAD